MRMKNENKRYKRIWINNHKWYSIAFEEQMYDIGDNKYAKIMPSTRYYNAYNTNYNSRERMGKAIMVKIVKIYLELMFYDLIYNAKEILLPFKYTLISVTIKEKDKHKYNYMFTKDGISNNFKLCCFWRNKKNTKKFICNMIPTNKIKGMIDDAFKKGVRYPKYK